MKLNEFICDNKSAIVDEWETFAGSLLPAAGGMISSALRDHAAEILTAICDDLGSPQNATEQAEKSKGRGQEHVMEQVGKAHAALRIEDGFKLDQLVAEYRALRASVLRLYSQALGKSQLGSAELQQVTRFNEALDEALVEATNRYMLVLNRTSDQFLAVLGHDLRNPLGAILMSAAMIARRPEEKSAQAAVLILSSAGRMKRMVHDLLDLTRTRLGSGIPVDPKPMDLEELCREAIAEMEALHPDRTFEFKHQGDLHGSWDLDRLAQVLSNLLGNAQQHGDSGSPILVRAKAEGAEVIIEVHNQGLPIPRTELANIFEPMVRENHGAGDKASRSLGLGLHIAREVVLAHRGTVKVESSAKGGTTFTVRLPRHAAAVEPEVEKSREKDRHDDKGEIVPEGESVPQTH